MSDGVLVRELPDGCREFVLEDPVLRALVVDSGVTLRFGRTDVVVTGPCTLTVDGESDRLDTGQPGSLAPLLWCLPGTARWLWSAPDGRLTVVFMQGQRLVVPGPPVPCAWSVGRLAGPGIPRAWSGPVDPGVDVREPVPPPRPSPAATEDTEPPDGSRGPEPPGGPWGPEPPGGPWGPAGWR